MTAQQGSNTTVACLCTGMGVVTTLIFWGSETMFWLVWQTDLIRELGAVLGLSVGYVVTYYLDHHHFFTNARISLRGTG